MEPEDPVVMERGAAVVARLPGVTPIRQSRSEATFHALIKAGRRALDAKSFDEMTIEDIARAASTSVGAFYGRFANKEAFFAAIQEITVKDIEAQLEAQLTQPEIEDASDEKFLEAIARLSVAVFRAHRGLYIASFKHASARPGAWSPIRRLGHKASGLFAARLAPRLKRLGKPATEREIRIGLQFMSGLLVNAVLNDPGPLSLDDKEIEIYICRFLCAFFGVRGDGKGRAR
jgi:AcrR family transcriptional regulator